MLPKTTYECGLLAEKVALSHCLSLGYRLLESRYRSPFGEIDLLFEAPSLNAHIIVEVKYRKQMYARDCPLTLSQQKRIMKTYFHYCATSPVSLMDSCQFDVITCTHSRGFFSLNHIENAFGHDEDVDLLCA